jgi:hypothetical protein
MIITKADPHQATGTGLVGKVLTTYADLVNTFGEPTLHGGDKVNVEWVLNFIDKNGDETIATIYDWKEPSIPMGETLWNIGGKNRDAYIVVAIALRGEEA